MKALVKERPGKHNMRIMDVPDPVCGENEVIIATKALGWCGTDYHIYTGEYDTAFPVIIGHEFSGDIVEVGKNVKNRSIGDKVFVECSTYMSCGSCLHCRQGTPMHCLNRSKYGLNRDGACAEYVPMLPQYTHIIPEGFTYEEMAIMEPVNVVYTGLLLNTRIEPDAFTVIIGPGPIGLLGLQMAKLYGARHVVMVGIDNDMAIRLPLAQELGADTVLNAQRDDVKAKILELTEGLGADLVYEASGSEAGIQLAVDIVRRDGRIGAEGVPFYDVTVNWKKLINDAVIIRYNFSSNPLSWRNSLFPVKRRAIDLKKLISHKIHWHDWEKLCEETAKGNVVKGVLTFE